MNQSKKVDSSTIIKKKRIGKFLQPIPSKYEHVAVTDGISRGIITVSTTRTRAALTRNNSILTPNVTLRMIEKTKKWRRFGVFLAILTLFPRPAHSSNKNNPSLSKPFQSSSFDPVPASPCVSLMTRAGRVGCGTFDRDVATGLLLPAMDVRDYRSLFDDNGESSLPDFVAVITEDGYGDGDSDDADDNNDLTGGFSADMAAFLSSVGAKGLLLLNTTSSSSSSSSSSSNNYSPASSCPQGSETSSKGVSPCRDYTWNLPGDNLLSSNLFGLPSGYVGDEDISDYLWNIAQDQMKAFLDNSGDDGSSSSSSNEENMELNPGKSEGVVAEFKSYMGPEDADSKTCLEWENLDGTRSPKCAPVGANSVWGALGSPPTDSFGNDDNGNDGDDNDDKNNNNNDNDERKGVILLATNLDAFTMFQDVAPGSNSAASNIIALISAAKLIGSNINDETIDSWERRIVFAFFHGENFGYLGSRSFLKDMSYPGFQCDKDAVPANSRDAATNVLDNEGNDADGVKAATMACLNPLRHDLDFMRLGDVSGMIAVDQVGLAVSSNNGNDDGDDDSIDDTLFYAHSSGHEGGGNDEADTASQLISNVLPLLYTEGHSVAVSSAAYDDNGDDNADNDCNDYSNVPVPPTPLASLLQLSGGMVGGTVLAGYDGTLADDARYNSHLDSHALRPLDLKRIAAAGTILARAAVAVARGDGDGDDDNDDGSNAVAYALDLIPDEIDPDDDWFMELADCFLINGGCNLFAQYERTTRSNMGDKTGDDPGRLQSLGTPPNYYPGIYVPTYGQPYVRVGGNVYGSYEVKNGKEYGKQRDDSFHLIPSLLEAAVAGLLDDYIGRGGFSEDDNDDDVDNLNNDDKIYRPKCKSYKDCRGSKVSGLCISAGDVTTCSGTGWCVCSRSRFHPAVDSAFKPEVGMSGGVYVVSSEENDDGNDEVLTAMYTEPYWSADIGITVYRMDNGNDGIWALISGCVMLGSWIAGVFVLRKKLMRDKLY